VPLGKSFGDLYQDAQDAYQIGDIVQVIFYGANPRNNLMTGESFLYVWRGKEGGERGEEGRGSERERDGG
jgi:hypothetical protein